MARTARATARLPRHHDTTWRPVMTGVGNDDWQRQADAAAWSAISNMPAELYLGAIEPIPVPAELRARMRQAAAELTAMPSRDRAETLLRLAHEAAYGSAAEPPVFNGAAGGLLESPRKPAGGVSAEWRGDTPAEPQMASGDALLRFAEEAGAALVNLRDDPANEGEQAFTAREWWE